MKFNSDTCKLLHVGEDNHTALYYMDANELESSGVKSEKGPWSVG